MTRSVRKAFASKGDDTTLSRWVKVPEAEQEPQRASRRQWRLPSLERADDSPMVEGRSIYSRRGVKDVSELKHVLVSGHNNVKIGRDVRKGWLRGYWIFTLSLEERRTCPRTCHHWRTCYGNNMPFARRVRHGPELEAALEAEIPRLLEKRPGILVRLHALGDFYSVDYVDLWARLLDLYPTLAVFGYTAWHIGTPIGDRIARIKERHGRRFSIRWSDGGAERDCTVSVRLASTAPAGSTVCPEQTGATAACATCGLCWGTDRNIAFVQH